MAAFQTLLGLGSQRGATTYHQLYAVESTGWPRALSPKLPRSPSR
jgi:hypothetical protein